MLRFHLRRSLSQRPTPKFSISDASFLRYCIVLSCKIFRPIRSTNLSEGRTAPDKEVPSRKKKTRCLFVWVDCERTFRGWRLLREPVAYSSCSRKEVIQPQVPLRLPCYDFAPVTDLAFGRSLPRVGSRTSGTTGFHGVTGGVYKARERIHRGMADPRLLAIPTSRSRVADCDPNLDRLCGIRSSSRYCSPLYRPL